MNRSLPLALALTMIMGGCADRKAPFSRGAFLAAKSQCGAPDAYIIEAAPNTIGFHGTSDDHINQAKCLKEKLKGTDVRTVVLGSRLYE
ncbi:MAG: hypothetical protein V4610_19555 [Pseudomonadota bacterium]|jgi:hypothetical protein